MSRRKQSKPRALKRELEGGTEEPSVAMDTPVVQETTADQPLNSTEQDVTGTASPLTPHTLPRPGDATDMHPERGNKTEGTSPKKEPVPGVIAMTTREEEEVEEAYRCEACSTNFGSLTQFMDHRNFECTAGELEGGTEEPSVAMDTPVVQETTADQPLNSTEQGAGSDLSWHLAVGGGGGDLVGVGARSPDGSSLYSSDNSPRTPSPGRASPLSPTAAALPLDQLPHSLGTSETHPFGCQFCEQAFPRLSYLKRHEQIHADQLPYRCRFCTRMFKHKRSRDRHVRLHTGDRQYTCRVCRTSFSRSDHLKIHVKTHETDRPFLCPVCPKTYDSLTSLTSHMVSHKSLKKVLDEEDSDSEAGALPTDFICPQSQCAAKCASIEEFQVHMQTHSEEASMDMSKQEILTCPYCPDVFVEEDVLEMHVEQMHTTDNMNKCPLCAVCFLDVADLQLHLRSHETLMLLKDGAPVNKKKRKGIKEISASLSTSNSTCMSSSASSSSSMSTPVSVGAAPGLSPNKIPKIAEDAGSSSGLGQLDCPYCSRKGFTTLGMLNVHIRTMHTGITDHLFACQVCQVSFSSSIKLMTHMQKEHPSLLLPEKSLDIKFPCDYCTLEFNNSDVLKQHKETIHKVSELTCKQVDVVYCSQCTMVLPHIYALAEHMHNSHGYNKFSPSSTPNKGDHSEHLSPQSDTGRRSSTPKDLSKSSTPGPAMTGLQNESYLCDHCNANFQDLKSYQVHIKNHVEVNLAKFSCTECGAEFTSEEQLETHVFVHFLVLTTEYGCTSCLKLFTKPDELQKHLMDIHAHHLYRCSLCKEVFDSKVNVQVHFAIKHSNECKLYKCAGCSSVFRSEMEWQLHVKVHHLGVSNPYRCFFCKESYGNEADMQTHLATHQKQYTCPLCDDAFHVEYLLDKHIQKKHNPESNHNTTLNSPMASALSDNSDTKNGVRLEAHPLEESPSPSANEIPINYVLSPVVSSGTKMTSVKQQLPSPSLSNDKSSNKASSPAYSIHSNPASLKKGDLNHKCEICDVVFSDEGSLQNHRVHDHSISPEMQLVFQKSKANHQAALNLAASKVTSVNSSDKFSQLCVYCNQTFKTKSELEKHMKTHVTPSNQKCNICDEIFPSASILAEHKLTHCKVVKGNVCVVCKVAMKNEEAFYTHSQQHGFQGTNMQCVVCRQTLASMLELQMHGRHHFQNPANFYTCCVCLKTFDSKENLVSKLNTSGRTYYVCKPCYHGETMVEFRCPTCSVKFESQVQLETHMLQHRKTFQCIKCQQSFGSEYEIQMHVATHVMQEGNVHECHICARIFESPAKLQLHLIKHTFEGGELKCYVCNAIFTQPSAIQMHVLEHGMGARRYACSHCPQKFFFSSELQNHIHCHGTQINHTPTPPAATVITESQCPECAKVFSSASLLAAHRKTHKKNNSNNSQLKCSLCAESYGTMIDLQQHFFLAHSGYESMTMESFMGKSPGGASVVASKSTNSTPGGSHKCVECQREFPSVSSLQGHMRIHTSGGGSKHACSECGKEFAGAKHLNLHMRAQHGEKPYECPICHKRFSRKENRKAHMKSHSGNKPYMCPVCTRSFTRKCHVKEHMKVHFTQPSTHTCDLCGEMYSRSKHLRRHLVTAHQHTPDFYCKLCSSPFPVMRELRHHLQGLHKINDDLMDALSVSSEEPEPIPNLMEEMEGVEADDTSDSLSLHSSELGLHNGTRMLMGQAPSALEKALLKNNHMEAVKSLVKVEKGLDVNPRLLQGSTIDGLTTMDGSISMVTTNTPEQVPVN